MLNNKLGHRERYDPFEALDRVNFDRFGVQTHDTADITIGLDQSPKMDVGAGIDHTQLAANWEAIDKHDHSPGQGTPIPEWARDLNVPTTEQGAERLVSPLILAELGAEITNAAPWIPTPEEIEETADVKLTSAVEEYLRSTFGVEAHLTTPHIGDTISLQRTDHGTGTPHFEVTFSHKAVDQVNISFALDLGEPKIRPRKPRYGWR